MKEKGRILKGVGGFYEVLTKKAERIVCKGKGSLKQGDFTLMVGDVVDVEIPEKAEEMPMISYVYARRNLMLRPMIANVDLGVLIVSIQEPEISTLLVDTMLINFKHQGLACILCFSKSDLLEESARNEYSSIYRKAAERILFTSVKTKEGIGELRELLQGKISVFAGVSASGKSSLINVLARRKEAVGALSQKGGRGKHTTRKSEIFSLDEDTFLADTPGFSRLSLWDVEPEKIRAYYDEFTPHLPCYYPSCLHIHEPLCNVKAAVEEEQIPFERYTNYVKLVERTRRPKGRYS